MRLLELFSGTGSIGKEFRKLGWHVVSVDLDPEAGADICKSVLDLSAGEVGHVDLIWASPPCTEYSIARTNAKRPRNYDGADALVRKVLDLADELNVMYFFENPYSGYLKSRPVVADLDYRVVDYCKYAGPDFPHHGRKRTAIWTNTGWIPSRVLCKKDCGYCVGNCHVDIAQRGGRTGCRGHSLNELFAMPPELCADIAAYSTRLIETLNV